MFDDRNVALMTGGTHGIGRGTVAYLLKRG